MAVLYVAVAMKSYKIETCEAMERQVQTYQHQSYFYAQRCMLVIFVAILGVAEKGIVCQVVRREITFIMSTLPLSICLLCKCLQTLQSVILTEVGISRLAQS